MTMATRYPITTSNRFLLCFNGSIVELVDSLNNRVLAEEYALTHMTEVDDEGAHLQVAPPKMIRVCQKLNERDFARRRQYGESRAAFAARTGKTAI